MLDIKRRLCYLGIVYLEEKMGSYKLVMHRSYVVTVEAPSLDEAKSLCEYYLGDCPDLSTAKDREQFNFRITGMEMRVNEVEGLR